MRINSIMPGINVSYNNDLQYNPAASFKHQVLRDLPIGFYNDYNIKPAQGISVITFTGDTTKNMSQIASLCFENKGTGLAEDSQGGMGVVTMEGPASMNKHEGMDSRSFIPFHEYNNPKGGYRFIQTKNIELVDGRLPQEIEAKYFISANPGQSREDLARALRIEPEDLRYVIQSEPSSKGPNGKSKYVLIEPTSVKGSFEKMDDIDIGNTKQVNYELFRFADDNPSYVKLDKNNYWIFTQDFAKVPKPYTYGPEGQGGMAAEIINSDYSRAVKESLKQMNTEEFNYFNPASIWGHDRPVAWFYSHIAGDSDFAGTISHHTLHNPRRVYQGFTFNPFEFARAIFSVEDVKRLAESQNYDILQTLNARGWNNLTDAERNFVRREFEPYIGVFKDYFGSYNITKIPIVAKIVNPDNISVGTVSPAFEEQMRDPNMDVAPGLGEDFKTIKMTSPLNGSTPANLGIGNNTSDFGRGNNTLSLYREGFTPLIYDGKNIEEIIANREKNAIWLTDILKNAETKGAEEVNRVFFNDMQIEQGRSVFGSISNFKKGDMLVTGWGRPDPQKGFPISVKGVLKFFKRTDIPEEMKMRVHFQFGWGDLPFDKNSRDWKLVNETFNEIMSLENGKYARNFQMCDGRYPNKLVACATHTLFTSRDEICGITPFESMSAGVPYGTTAAGGPKGYTDSSIGWKTVTAPEMNPEFDNLTWDTPADVIDDARVNRSSDEVSDMLKNMSEEYFNDKPSYVEKCKNCIERKTDWHNNSELNGGKSANKMYIEDIWKISEGWDGRDKSSMRRLVGQTEETLRELVKKAPETAATVMENIASEAQKAGTKWTKVAIGAGVAIAAIGCGSYAYLKQAKTAANAVSVKKLNHVA